MAVALSGSSLLRHRRHYSRRRLSILGVVSENICYTDAYARETDATVLDVDPEANAVLLDRTVFYPGGGGQPADAGELIGAGGGAWTVTGARKRGDDIWHSVESEPPAAGTQVTARLDWDRRHRLMRTHSALHVLCGVVWRDHGASVTGGNMEPLSGRMDFEFETMSGELVGEIEKRVNEEIAADREIRVAILPRDEAFAIPDLIRTKVNLLPEGITRGPDHRDRRARPPGRWRDARLAHRRDRARDGQRLRVEGPHQQADPHRGHGVTDAAAAGTGVGAPFLLGVNYWPRTKAMWWWARFDAGEVSEEFAMIRSIGLGHVRIFLLWESFQPRPDEVSVDALRSLRTVADLGSRCGPAPRADLLHRPHERPQLGSAVADRSAPATSTR